MRAHRHSKPEVFGKGYGSHMLDKYRLFKTFVKLSFKVFVNIFAPSAYYEKYHWEVIDLYYKFRGFRHGTDNSKRCDACGSELEPRPEPKPITPVPRKPITITPPINKIEKAESESPDK